MSDRTLIPQEILDDAAEWFARLETESSSEKTRADFVKWLTRSPVHIEEFLRVAALHHALSSELRAHPEWLADVLADVGTPEENVVRMADPEPMVVRRDRYVSAHGRRLLAAAAVLTALVGLGALVRVTGLLPKGHDGERFATAVGEQRRIDLADGSNVLLNTDTELEVRMDRELRRVDLVRGEAIFDIEKEPARPFRVVGGAATIEAIGTRFIVHRQPEQTVVTVVEGRVRVEPTPGVVGTTGETPAAADEDRKRHRDGTPADAVGAVDATTRPLELEAGRRVTVGTDGTLAGPATADVESATSWTRGRMVFDAETLDAVVAQFNRYHADRLVITDPALAARRITGVFNIDDPEAFLAILSELGDLRVSRTAEGNQEIRFGAGPVPGSEVSDLQRSVPESP